MDRRPWPAGHPQNPASGSEWEDEHVPFSRPIFPLSGISNDGSGPRSSTNNNNNMADNSANDFFAPAAHGEVNYQIVGEIPDDWAIDLNMRSADDMGELAFPPMPEDATPSPMPTAWDFEQLDARVIGKIFDYVGAQWNGMMPNMVIALRPSKAAYKLVLEHFVNTNKFVLCPGNKWSLGGMPENVIGRIKHLELAVCVCNLTDGDNTWVIPEETWCPKKKGLSSLESVTVYPSNIIHHLPQTSRVPAVLIAHQCRKNEQSLRDFLHRFAVFLRPFENLKSTTIHNCITPWVRVNKVGEAARDLKYVNSLTAVQIGFPGKVQNQIDTRIGQIAGQTWVWTVEEGTPGLDWKKMWKNIVPAHYQDLADLIDWDGLAGESSAAGGQDQGCKTQ